MHAREQAEIAAWLAVHSESIIQGSTRLEGLVAASYWSCNKSRLARWNAALKTFDHDIRHPDESHNPWPAIEVVVEEIIAAEMLTRIWSAILVSMDTQKGKSEMTGLAHSVFLGHMEARNRTMRLLLSGRGVNEKLFDRMNQLRRGIEKWTDLFLSSLQDAAVARRFAFDVARFDEYRGENDHYCDLQLGMRQQVLIHSMSSMLRSVTGKWSANPELNRRIVDGALGCIDREAFDVEGLPKSLKMLWIERAGSDAQILVSQLESMDRMMPGWN